MSAIHLIMQAGLQAASGGGGSGALAVTNVGVLSAHDLSADAWIDWLISRDVNNAGGDIYKSTGGQVIGRPVLTSVTRNNGPIDTSYTFTAGTGLRYSDNSSQTSPQTGGTGFTAPTSGTSKVTFALPAGITPRQANIAVGSYGNPTGSSIIVRATLSDASATAVTGSISRSGYGWEWREFKFDYNAAANGQTLTLSVEKNDTNIDAIGVSFIGYK